jgi:hypothetical protein
MSNHSEAVEDIKKAKEALNSLNYHDLKKSDHPDPTKHKYISFIKSGFRIAAGIALALAGPGYFQAAGCLLILAEVLGIAEEMV